MASDDGEYVKRISPDWHIYADCYEQYRRASDLRTVPFERIVPDYQSDETSESLVVHARIPSWLLEFVFLKNRKFDTSEKMFHFILMVDSKLSSEKSKIFEFFFRNKIWNRPL